MVYDLSKVQDEHKSKTKGEKIMGNPDSFSIFLVIWGLTAFAYGQLKLIKTIMGITEQTRGKK